MEIRYVLLKRPGVVIILSHEEYTVFALRELRSLLVIGSASITDSDPTFLRER